MIYIMIALTPFSFKCGKCKSRIYVKDVILWIMLMIVVMGTAAAITLNYIFYTGKVTGSDLLYFIIPAMIVAALEFMIALLICNKARLVCKEKKG